MDIDIDISHLRQHLPEYLARVRQGERVRVTSRGRVVAELVPPSSPPAAAAARERLNDSALRYEDTIEPVRTDDESRPRRT